MNNSNGKTRRLAGLALFTAIVVVLQLLGSFIKVGPFAVSLVLIPIVVGAAVYGVSAGAWLGFVFGVVVTIAVVTGADQGGYIMFSARPVMTVLVCLIKGTAAGLVAGALGGGVAGPCAGHELALNEEDLSLHDVSLGQAQSLESAGLVGTLLNLGVQESCDFLSLQCHDFIAGHISPLFV